MKNNEGLPYSVAETQEITAEKIKQNKKVGEEVLEHFAIDEAAEQHTQNDESEQQSAESDINKRIQELMTTDEIVENLPNLIEQGADVNGIIDRLDPGQVAANLDILIADKSKVDLDKLIDKLPPRVVMLNADKLKALDPGIDEINRTIEEQLTPQEIAEQLDSLIEQGADVNLIIDKLDSWTIADNLTTFLQNKAKLDMGKLVDKLPDWVVALSLDRLKKAGASINQQELFSKLNPNDIANELSDLIKVGADVSVLISCLEPQAIVDNLDLLLTDKKNAATIFSILEKSPGAIALNVKKLTDAGIRVREKQVMKRIPSEEIAKNIPELIESGIEVKTIINNLSPEDILENLDKFGDEQESIDFKTLLGRVTPDQIATHIDAFIKHQVDIKDIFVRLDSAGIAANLETLLQNKVNINEIIISLSPEDLASKLNDIIEAGGNINLIIDGLDQKYVIKNLDTFIGRDGLDFARLAAKIGPRAVLNDLEKLLSAAKQANVEINIDQLTEDLNAEAIATNEDNLDRLIRAGSDATVIAKQLLPNPDLFKKELNKLLSYGAELDKIAEYAESWPAAEIFISYGIEADKVVAGLEPSAIIEHADHLIASGAKSETILSRLNSNEIRDNLNDLLEAGVDVNAIMDSLESIAIAANIDKLVKNGGADIRTVVEKLDADDLAAFAILICNKYQNKIDPNYIFNKLGESGKLTTDIIVAFKTVLGDVDVDMAAKYLSTDDSFREIGALIGVGVSPDTLLDTLDLDSIVVGAPPTNLKNYKYENPIKIKRLMPHLEVLIDEGGVDLRQIIERVKPVVALDGRELFRENGIKIDVPELAAKLTPLQKAGRIIELNQEGANIDANELVTQLEPAEIAAHITDLLEAGANIDVNAIVSQLEPYTILQHIKELQRAGAEIDVTGLVDQLDKPTNHDLADLLDAGADEEKILSIVKQKPIIALGLARYLKEGKVETSKNFLNNLAMLMRPYQVMTSLELFDGKLDLSEIAKSWEPETIANWYDRLSEAGATIDVVDLTRKLYAKNKAAGIRFVTEELPREKINSNYDALSEIVDDEKILPKRAPRNTSSQSASNMPPISPSLT